VEDWNALLIACHHDDPAARERLFTALRVRLLTIAQYRLRGTTAEILEDLVHGSLTLVIERIAAIESNPHLYALQILRNKIGDYLRTRSRRLEQPLNPTDWEGDEESGRTTEVMVADPEAEDLEIKIESSEAVETIRRAIKRLTPICQALFLGLLEGRSINEVWELAQSENPRLSRSTFDKRLFDCRKRLRALVGAEL
jgi:RNA polymerase sigma factor (sigma-70 family)